MFSSFFWLLSLSFYLEVLVIKHLKATVWHEYLRHAYTLWCLIVLDDGSHDTWQSKCRSVKSVAKLNLSCLCIAVAAVQAVGLITLEVRYRRYLQPALLCCAPHLEVVAYSRCEAHVATAQT